MIEVRHFWVVSVVQRFENMELGSVGGLPVQVRTEAEPHAYLPVFDTREAAIAWNNGKEDHIYEMQAATPERPAP
jgi:hypothetical protein